MDAYEKIRIIRQLSKQTQTEFGESLGLSKATISNFETGRVPIPNYVTILLKLLKIVGFQTMRLLILLII